MPSMKHVCCMDVRLFYLLSFFVLTCLPYVPLGSLSSPSRRSSCDVTESRLGGTAVAVFIIEYDEQVCVSYSR
ncbi:hypothetical protein F4804DRAFT_305093 [Jackrogersella minutella]|nr:hypothetical protein F4804DRAFT_305093 [Jackrogersella minutella]